MPQTAEKMLERLGVSKKALDLRLDADGQWGMLVEGVTVAKGESLFPRVEVKKRQDEKLREPAPKPARTVVAGAPPAQAVAQAEVPQSEPITIETFKSVDLRVGVIKQAERIPKADKLLRLIVDIGEERQVVAGIAQTHTPEDLLGKQVILVANLKPTKLKGVESQGMVLAVRDGDALALLTPEHPVTPGGRVS
jgi:methionyl-tRNA synthetase